MVVGVFVNNKICGEWLDYGKKLVVGDICS